MSDSTRPGWPRFALLAAACGMALAGCHGADTASMMAEARQYRDQGDPRAAVIQLKNVIQHDAANQAARVLLAELYLEQADPASAEKELRRALALGADSGKVALMLAKALLMQGQYERLLADVSPDAAPAQQPALLAMRGNALLGLLRIEPARALFNQALKLNPDAPEALLGLVRIASWQQQPDTARTLLARALAANPDDVDCLRYQADQLRADGQGEAALAVQQQVLRRRPNNAQTLVEIANIHTDASRFAEAHKALDQARKAPGAGLALLYAQAMLSFRENKLDAALETVQRVLGVAPEHYPSVLLAGAIQAARGSPDEAELHLRKFLQSYPQHLYASKVLIGVHLGARRPDAALAVLEPMLLAHPDDAELLALAGETQLQARQFERAARYFERASALQPQLPSLHTGLALSRLGSGDSARAIDELERAARLDRTPGRTGVLLVMAYLRANQTDKALDSVLQMEQRDNNPLVQNLKGGIFLARKDPAAARACFDKALALDPAYLPALANLEQLDVLEHKAADTAPRYLAALAHAPASSALMEALAGLALTQGNRTDAITWMERASAAQPDSLPLAIRAAELFLRAGDKQKALLLARKLQAAHPGSADALALLGQAYTANGSYALAEDSYARLAALTPGTAMPQLRLAAVQIAQNRNAAALDSLRKAVTLEPDAFAASRQRAHRPRRCGSA